ncbi:hypothetical protein GQ42DRAFT_161599 [Ramicandelaber brevisporus]|nr:hypothetical protein GQ42DRAFT_161599 [Ramicandelaber brevisporus]
MKELVKEKVQSLMKSYAKRQSDGRYRCICPCCRGSDGTGFTVKKSRDTIRHHIRYMLPRIVVMESNSAQYRHLPPGPAPYPTPSGALQIISTSNVIQEAHAPRPHPASTVSSAPVQQNSSLDSDSVPASSIQPMSVASAPSRPTLMPIPLPLPLTQTQNASQSLSS